MSCFQFLIVLSKERESHEGLKPCECTERQRSDDKAKVVESPGDNEGLEISHHLWHCQCFYDLMRQALVGRRRFGVGG